MGAQMQSVAMEVRAKRFFNFEQAMVYLGKSEFALRALIKKKKIIPIKRDGRLSFEVSELDRYMGFH